MYVCRAVYGPATAVCGGELVRTGFGGLGLMVLGLALVLCGLSLLRLARRQRRTPDTVRLHTWSPDRPAVGSASIIQEA